MLNMAGKWARCANMGNVMFYHAEHATCEVIGFARGVVVDPDDQKIARGNSARSMRIDVPKDTLVLFAAVVAGTVVFSLAAHAFAYFNLMPQHDALIYLTNLAGTWENRIGRFMLPLLARLHFGVFTPWFAGLLCMACMSFASYFVCKVCGISKLWAAFLAAGALSANLSFIEINSVYSYISDPYALSLALSAGAVHLAADGAMKPRALKAALVVALLFFAVGIYQTAGAFAVVLFAVRACRDFLSNERSVGATMKSVGCWIAEAAVALVVYVFVCARFGLFDYLHSMRAESIAGTYPVDNAFGLFKFNFMFLFNAFFSSEGPLGVAHGICFGGLCVLAVCAFVRLVRERKVGAGRVVAVVIVALVLPIVVMLPCYLFVQYSYRMCYSAFLAVPVLLALVSTAWPEGPSIRAKAGTVGFSSAPAAALAALLAFAVLGGNVALANTAYTYQKVLYDRALVQSARVLENIDETEGYVAGETQVVVVGERPGAASALPSIIPDGFRDLDGFEHSAATYDRTFAELLRTLGESAKFSFDAGLKQELEQTSEVQNMPSYPQEGCVAMVDGTLVIKF